MRDGSKQNLGGNIMAKPKNGLDGVQKSAILLIALGPEKSAKILFENCFSNSSPIL